MSTSSTTQSPPSSSSSSSPSSSSPVVTEVKVSPAPAPITLAGKVAIVTGASRGIGQGIALRLARDGAKVIVNYQKDAKAAEAVVNAIKSVGGSATAVQADISSSADVDRLFGETKKVYGRVDIVVANAAIAAPFTPIANVTNELADKIINVDIKGVFYTLRAAANTIADGGRIIIVGSAARVGTFPGTGVYGAAKAAIEVLGNTLAQELGPRNVTVNTVHPGPVLTDMMNEVLTPELAEVMKNLSAFKRLGTVADIGDAVALLVTEGARWISGQAIFLTGAGKF